MKCIHFITQNGMNEIIILIDFWHFNQLIIPILQPSSLWLPKTYLKFKSWPEKKIYAQEILEFIIATTNDAWFMNIYRTLYIDNFCKIYHLLLQKYVNDFITLLLAKNLSYLLLLPSLFHHLYRQKVEKCDVEAHGSLWTSWW